MKVIRCHKDNAEFLALVDQLDASLRITDGEDHAFYNQYNGTDTLDAVVLLFDKDKAVSCGAYRIKNKNQVEIKRMFTLPSHRQLGCARRVLFALEQWATEENFNEAILETGINQAEALFFYPKVGYRQIQNFEPYIGVKNSFCFGKKL